MTGLAKSAPIVTQPSEPSPQIVQETPVPSMVWDGVPMDLYKYFSVDFFDAADSHKSEMRDIHRWASSKSDGKPGSVIQKIQELENRLGSVNVGETRLGKLSNYVRVLARIEDMQKQKRALEHGLRSY